MVKGEYPDEVSSSVIDSSNSGGHMSSRSLYTFGHSLWKEENERPYNLWRAVSDLREYPLHDDVAYEEARVGEG